MGEPIEEMAKLRERIAELEGLLGVTRGGLSKRAVEVRGEQVPVLEKFGFDEWKSFIDQEETARIQSLGEVEYKLVQFIKEEPLSLIEVALDMDAAELAALSNDEFRSKMTRYFAPPDRRGVLVEMEALAMPKPKGDERDIVTEPAFHKYLVEWKALLKRCPAGTDESPPDKLIVKAFNNGLQPRVVRLRSEAENHKSIDKAMQWTLRDVKQLAQAQKALGLVKPTGATPSGKTEPGKDKKPSAGAGHQRPPPTPRGPGGSGGGSGGKGGGNGKDQGTRQCFLCSSPDHLKPDCPRNKKNGGDGKRQHRAAAVDPPNTRSRGDELMKQRTKPWDKDTEVGRVTRYHADVVPRPVVHLRIGPSVMDDHAYRAELRGLVDSGADESIISTEEALRQVELGNAWREKRTGNLRVGLADRKLFLRVQPWMLVTQAAYFNKKEGAWKSAEFRAAVGDTGEREVILSWTWVQEKTTLLREN